MIILFYMLINLIFIFYEDKYYARDIFEKFALLDMIIFIVFYVGRFSNFGKFRLL